MRTIITAIFLLSLVSCKNESSNSKSTNTNTESDTTNDPPVAAENANLSERENAAQWLKANLEGAFNSERGSIEAICTPRYFEFKANEIDAFNEEEGALSLKEFNKKWSSIYKTELCKGQPFFIDAQDYGTIMVSPVFKADTPDGYWFTTQIRDDSFKTTYNRDIRVKKTANAYLVDEVIENASTFE